MSVKVTRVQRLELAHFRGIRHLTLEFTESVTVLVGVNGAGKTSILEALRTLLSDLLWSIRDQVAGVLPKTEQRDPPYLLPTDIHVGQRSTTLSVSTLIADQPIGWAAHGRTLLPGEIELDDEALEDVFIFAHELYERVREDPQTALPLAIYYAAGRSIARDDAFSGEDSLQNQLSAYAGALDGIGIASVSPFVAWFRRREDYENEKRLEDGAFRDAQLQAVRHAIAELLPGFSDLRIRRQPMRMVIRKGRNELELPHLSDGERYLLTLGADIARRLALANPNAEEPRLCSAIILIDEIETHLHPSWQRQVVPALARAFPNCQFIISTHSPQVLSNVRPDCIYLLTQEDGELRVMRPEASFGRDSNRILEDIMGVDERPSGIKQKLSDYFYLLDQGKMEEARSLRQELESLIGPSDPEFARADAITRARELIDEAHR
jgi:predicted ATP-binding protein involved in virulence